MADKCQALTPQLALEFGQLTITLLVEPFNLGQRFRYVSTIDQILNSIRNRFLSNFLHNDCVNCPKVFPRGSFPRFPPGFHKIGNIF